MAYSGELKIKLLAIWEMLSQDTDPLHPLGTNEIIARLAEKGIPCDRRTLAQDIKVLQEYGYEVQEEKVGKQNGYYMDDRKFSLGELKILIDAVQAASFVTEKKTKEIIEKLADLGGSNRATVMQGNLVRFNTRKHTNESILYNVDHLEEALIKKCKVSFVYFDLDENHKRVFRKDKQKYFVDPVALIFMEDNYYLMCYSDAYEKIVCYRVDRMQQVTVVDKPICVEAQIPEEKIGEFTEQTFKMYSGSSEKVTLRFGNQLIGVVYDKFGENTKMRRVDEDTCTACVKVQVSPTFWGWLFQFAGEMQIVEPQYLIDTYRHLLDSACE